MQYLRLVLLGFLATALGGCGGGGASRLPPLEVDPDAGKKAIDMYDVNPKDGFLDQRELDKVPGLKAAFKQEEATQNQRRGNQRPHHGLEGIEDRTRAG